MIRYGFLDSTPLGDILVAATEKGVCSVIFGKESKSRKLDTLKKRSVKKEEIIAAPDAVRIYTDALASYFSGKEKRLDIPVDLNPFCTPFQKKLYKALLAVPYGKTVTYGELAARIGIPKGSRAVGGGMGRNPIPLFVPCHRVVGANGALGGFSGGIGYKKTLLSLEAAR